MLLDLGNRELSAGLTFVALSRAMSLGCILFPAGKFPNRERLAMCETTGIESRQAVDSELEILSEKTVANRRRIIDAGIHFPQ